MIKEYLKVKLIETEHFTLTVYGLVVFFLILLGTWILLKLLRKIVNRKVNRGDWEKASTYAAFQIFRYIVWIMAIGIALETIGVRLNILIASSAALLVGVGLGLQQVFMDYVAGIIILFEGIIKVDDVVEISSLIGQVKHIGLRTSKITTRDDLIIVVPNHKLVNDNVINWSHNRKLTRFDVRVGVAYGSNTEKVKNVLIKLAKDHPLITSKPEPFVRFEDFADSSLNFGLYFYTEHSFRVENIKSDLRFGIDTAFREAGITIPFPQRDVHFFSEPNQSTGE
ncbi:MAG: mechanosensitive ion channel [Bacteroidales bacterium]